MACAQPWQTQLAHLLFPVVDQELQDAQGDLLPVLRKPWRNLALRQPHEGCQPQQGHLLVIQALEVDGEPTAAGSKDHLRVCRDCVSDRGGVLHELCAVDSQSAAAQAERLVAECASVARVTCITCIMHP